MLLYIEKLNLILELQVILMERSLEYISQHILFASVFDEIYILYYSYSVLYFLNRPPTATFIWETD